MRYFVIADDGHRYGPADTMLLNQWIGENRLRPHQFLEEELTGQRVLAQAVPGLRFPLATQTAPYMPGGGLPPGVAYPRPHMSSGVGSRDLTPSWILFGVGMLCMCNTFFGLACPIAGAWFAYRAEHNRVPGARTALVANILLLVISSLVNLFAANGQLNELIRSIL